MNVTRFVTALLVVLFVASPAVAQENQPVENAEFGVTVTPPAKWEAAEGNDKAVASFKHKDSQSQIEVVGTKLMTPDVADVFFETFHKTLKESNFEKVSQDAATIGDYEGSLSAYKFTHSGKTLKVRIFQFIHDSSAWLVVGYMQDSDKDKYVGDFKSVVKNMTFESKE